MMVVFHNEYSSKSKALLQKAAANQVMIRYAFLHISTLASALAGPERIMAAVYHE
jgi:hypothetical protein